MKKITLIALFLFALTSVASAAPLMDFDKGKVAIDYTFRPSLDFAGQANLSGHIGSISGAIGLSRDFDGDSNNEFGLTVGIGNKWGLQYRQYNPTGNIWSGSISTVNLNFDAKIRTDEFNLLYGFNKNFAGFIGVARTQAGISAAANGTFGSITIPELWSEHRNNFQIGFVGSYKIADKTHFWGLASVSSDYRNWEAGVSYDISKDLQFNLSYRDTRYEKLKFASVNLTSPDVGVDLTTDVTVKGLGVGLTYKF